MEYPGEGASSLPSEEKGEQGGGEEMKRRAFIYGLVIGAALILTIGGCASTPLEFVKTEPTTTFDRYNAVVIKEFENSVGQDLPARIPVELRAAVETRLSKCYPGILRIAPAAAAEAPDTIIVEGRITEYREGNRFARFMLIGLGSAKFSSDVVFRDAQSRQELAQAKVDLLWAMGGIVGAMSGIDDLVKKASEQVADAVVEKKGIKKNAEC